MYKSALRQFYAKLDILNRIYVLNYFNVGLLEASSLINLKQLSPDQLNMARENSAITGNAYFNLADKRLLLAGISTRKIDFLFRQVLLHIVQLDKSIRLDSRILIKLRENFSSKELDILFKHTAVVEHSEFKAYILEHDTSEIIAHLKHAYFTQLLKSLPIPVTQRFMLEQPKQDLLAKLHSYDLEQIVAEKSATAIPAITLFN